jgi:hypothetical protein
MRSATHPDLFVTLPHSLSSEWARSSRLAMQPPEIGSLFDAVGEDCNTINFRVLWQDTILTRDHRIMQQVLATSFPEFEKGVTVKLKCVLSRPILRLRLDFSSQGYLICLGMEYSTPTVHSGKLTGQ